MLRRTLWILLVLPLTALAQEDKTLFGKAGDAYGPKADSLTFTPYAGAYWHGQNQLLLNDSDRRNDIWNYGLRLGWAFTREFEVEGMIGHTRTKTPTSQQNVFILQANALGQYAVWDTFVPYATFGLGSVRLAPEFTSTANRFAINYGLGLKYFPFRNLAIRPDFRLLTSFGNVKTAFLATLNLEYYVSFARPKPAATPTPAPAPEVTPEAPATPAPISETTPTPAATATPVGDRDKDGILDDKDACPDGPETVNGFKDEDGCPDHEIDEFSGVIEGIKFETGNSIIQKESYPKLDRATEVLKKYSQIRIQIDGHTDSTGGKRLNMSLSLKRAESVRQYFLHRGIERSRMQIHGFGPTKPIASNATDAGRRQNRRIEFRILNREVLQKP